MENGIVRVHTECYVLQSNTDGRFSVVVPALGISGHGGTEEEAHQSARRVFGRFINGHRRAGQLESVLDRTGVEWSWVQDDTAPTGAEDSGHTFAAHYTPVRTGDFVEAA